MKNLVLLILTACALVINAHATVCCPQPPEGYDCAEEPMAILPGSAQIATATSYFTTDVMIWETHVTQYISIQHPISAGWTYEVQYTDSLDAPVWKAYARVVAPSTNILTTHVPIYPCVAQRFFRVCAQAP